MPLSLFPHGLLDRMNFFVVVYIWSRCGEATNGYVPCQSCSFYVDKNGEVLIKTDGSIAVLLDLLREDAGKSPRFSWMLWMAEEPCTCKRGCWVSLAKAAPRDALVTPHSTVCGDGLSFCSVSPPNSGEVVGPQRSRRSYIVLALSGPRPRPQVRCPEFLIALLVCSGGSA